MLIKRHDLRPGASTRLPSPPRSRRSAAALHCSALRAGLLALGVAGLGLAPPAAAASSEPTCDIDCPKGTACELTSICPAIFCEDPTDCPPCTPQFLCVPAACASDDDCGTDMRCAEFTSDCPVDPLLVPPAPPTGCEPSTIRQCTPRWQLQCTVDADCGEGFSCEDREVCEAPASPPDPYGHGAELPPVTCHPSGNLSCVPLEIACASDDDCPAAFACADNPNGVCSSSSDGQTTCEPADPQHICVLRSFGVVAIGDGAAGVGEAPAALASDEAAAPGAVLPIASTPTSDLERRANVERTAKAGHCSISMGSSSGGWIGLLGTLGCVALFRRRRQGVLRTLPAPGKLVSAHEGLRRTPVLHAPSGWR